MNINEEGKYYVLFLPCDYVRHFEDGTDADVTKTFQAVA